MIQRTEAVYLRQRARSSHIAATEAADRTARSAHARLALAYDDRAQAVEQLANGESLRLESA